MNSALSPLPRLPSQGMAVSKKVIDDPMAPDTDEIDATDDIFDRPFDTFAPKIAPVDAATDAAEDDMASPAGPKLNLLLSPFAWLTDKVMSSESRVRITGTAKAIYSFSVRSVMGARAQMESYSPPIMGEFSHKLSLKWGIVRPNLLLKGQFRITPMQGVSGRSGEHVIALRSRLPLLPVLPWVVVAALPAVVPVLINLIIGFSWHGPALAAGWVALTSLPLVGTYISTARRTTWAFVAGIVSGLNEDALLASQSDRSSMVALVPARPVFADHDDDAFEIAAPVAPVVKKPVVVAAAPKPLPVEPVKAILKTLATKPAEPKKAMTMDAQALVKAQMASQIQAQLEAQLEALGKAEIELKAAPAPVKPVSPAPTEVAIAPVPHAVSSARVRSRIKKFRTRYDVASKPEKLEAAPSPQPTETATLSRKIKV